MQHLRLNNIESWFVKEQKVSKSFLCHASKGSAFDQDGCEKMNIDLEMPPILNQPIESNEEQENCGNVLSQEDWECKRPHHQQHVKNHQSRKCLHHNVLSNSI